MQKLTTAAKGSPVAGASLRADVVEVDVVDSTIIMGADNRNTIDMETTTTIACRGDLLHLDAIMAWAALVTENALVSFVALPGTKPSSALRQAKHQCLSLRRFFVLKPCHAL